MLDDLVAKGRHSFTSTEAQAALGRSREAVKVVLSRLAQQQLIASPSRGFYVIVPPQYRALGCIPADQFVPELMKVLDAPYYAGVLTAAQYHGAAHQRPQEFQVCVNKPRKRLSCGHVRIAFFIRKRLRDVPVQRVNTVAGTLLISTPEATAVDLVGYQDRAGGLGNVATVLAELAERLDPVKLAAAAATAPLPWGQRLGYLLERIGAPDKTAPLKAHVRARAHDTALLLPKATHKNAPRDNAWKLLINAQVETDL